MTDSRSQKKGLCLSLELHDATGECAHAVRFSEEEAGGRICTGIVDGQHWDCPTPPEHKVVAGRGRCLVCICLGKDMEEKNEPLRRRIHPDGSR